MILNLHRGTSVISNPRASRELEAGDSLLCYGELDEMRDLVPDPKQRRKRKLRARRLSPETLEQIESDRQEAER